MTQHLIPTKGNNHGFIALNLIWPHVKKEESPTPPFWLVSDTILGVAGYKGGVQQNEDH